LKANVHGLDHYHPTTDQDYRPVVLAILSVALAVVGYTTHWDWWLRDDMVEKVAERFDLSYSNDAAARLARRS